MQHRAVVFDRDDSQPRVTQGGDRDRRGVVLVGLVAATRRQHSDPSRERRGNINHCLARGDELLGEEPADTVRAFDAPTAFGERGRPCDQLFHLAAVCSDADLAVDSLGCVDGFGGVGTLMRISTDRDHVIPPVVGWMEHRGGHS